MSQKAKKEYLEEIRKRYKLVDKNEKNKILDEFCTVCGYNRKYAIRLINGKQKRVKRKPGRPKIYDNENIMDFLKHLWKATNLICSTRLKAAIPNWLPYYKGRLTLDERGLIEKISARTIDRLLHKVKSKYKKLGLSTTKPGSLLKKQIPVKTRQWDETRPGFIEADTVAHCGTSVSGQFVYSVQIVDIATGWGEARAVWGKGQTGVFNALKSIEEALPFRVLGFDSDNGGEFINKYLLAYFTKRKVQFTRSREYEPNDNSHIEQKNWTNIRQYLGYSRFDNPKIVLLLNDLFQNEWTLFFNFFLPSVKLIDKRRDGSRIIKVHDKPLTPFQRLIESDKAKPAVIKQLKHIRASLDPFLLHKVISTKIKNILSFVP